MGQRGSARTLAAVLAVSTAVLAGCGFTSSLSDRLAASVSSAASSTPTATTTAAPDPASLALTCPPGGTQSAADFGHDITATRPYTVTIDYGDGQHYTNGDQYLDVVFAHAYSAPGSFTVTATLTDAAGRKATATCVYAWTAPAAAAAPSSAPGITKSKPASPEAPVTPAPQPFVRSGDPCPVAGMAGTTADGTALVCASGTNDPQPRWRAR